MLGYSIASRAIADHFRRNMKQLDNDMIVPLPVLNVGRVQAQYLEQNSIKPTRG